MFGAGDSLQGGRGFRGDWGISGALVSPRNDAVLPAGRRGLGLPAPCPRQPREKLWWQHSDDREPPERLGEWGSEWAGVRDAEPQ